MLTSRAAAWTRLMQIESKMDRNPEFGQEYVKKMQYYIEQNYIVPLDEKDLNTVEGETWYLPHFAVFNPNKLGKIRIVLDASDWKGGEIYLLRLAQRESFNFTNDLVKSTSSTNFLSLDVEKGDVLYKFNSATDQDGLVRTNGRLQRIPRVSPEFKNPIILHAENRIVQLLLSSYHERLGHWGPDYTLAELRTRFEIIKGRTILKSLQRGCKKCQIARAKPSIPIMGQLPPERLDSHVIPFTYTGCDMFGPIMTKVGRREVKRYGMIFTCLVTRTIHLELYTSMTTDSFLMALRRFFAHHTVPAKILSDCGSNFRGAKKELADETSKLNLNEIADKMAQLNVE
uniref:Integrase zinc-binding domain-containing protein n=1 Tax=Phlebotomus papatasi TaxID=29031 RepID=A0A1B0D333_PHLPP